MTEPPDRESGLTRRENRHGLNRPTIAAVLGCMALMAYASIKAAWGLGSTIGISDAERWESEVANLETWQWLIASWGTVLLDLGAAASLITLSKPPPGKARRSRRLLRRFSSIAAIVVGTVGIVGFTSTSVALVFSDHGHDDVIAPWVFMVVYGSFAAVGAAFIVVISDDHVRDRERSSALGLPRERTGGTS
jgi:hypothetical protein